MALGDFSLFQWKSKQQLAKEANEYAAWAFPFGDLQKEKLEILLRELVPKENKKMLLISFLTCKELYESVKEDTEFSDELLRTFVKRAERHKTVVKKKELTTYLAAVLADAEIDEQCNYPSADEILQRIEELNQKLL